MNLILCGLPKSGKTTIGKLLSEKIQWNFIDIDSLIEQTYCIDHKFSCREIYKKEGEHFFRKLEHEQICSLKDIKYHVISTGGGSICNPDNITILESLGTIIYLKVPSSTLWNRAQQQGIPAFLNQHDPERSFHELAIARVPLYESAAHLIIDTAHLHVDAILDTLTHYKEITYGK